MYNSIDKQEKKCGNFALISSIKRAELRNPNNVKSRRLFVPHFASKSERAIVGYSDYYRD
jgi:hypothetical protein